MARVASTNQDFFKKFREMISDPNAYGGKVTNPGRSLTGEVIRNDRGLILNAGYLGDERAEYEDTLMSMLHNGPVVIGYSYGTPIIIAQNTGGGIEYWETKQKYSTTTSRHHSGYRVAMH